MPSFHYSIIQKEVHQQIILGSFGRCPNQWVGAQFMFDSDLLLLKTLRTFTDLSEKQCKVYNVLPKMLACYLIHNLLDSLNITEDHMRSNLVNPKVSFNRLNLWAAIQVLLSIAESFSSFCCVCLPSFSASNVSYYDFHFSRSKYTTLKSLCQCLKYSKVFILHHSPPKYA